MPTKIRKQIYLEKQHDRQLKRLAEARGVSEAAIIRALIDTEASSQATNALPPDRAAWEDFARSARQRTQLGQTGEPYQWNREEIYAERFARYDPSRPVSPSSRPPTDETQPPDRTEE